MSTLLERGAELGHLEGLLRAASDGTGRGVVVEGPAGIGKTALLRHLAEQARERGFGVAHARGGELEREMAFGVVRQLFERLLTRTDDRRREASLTGVPEAARRALGLHEAVGWTRQLPQEEEFSILHGVYWLCANLSEGEPLLVVVDDAHWADRSSLRWLAYLLRRVEPLRVLAVVGVRTQETAPPDELLLAIAAEPSVSVLRPRPLSERGVGELVRQEFAEDADPDFCRACHRAAGGNPFFSRELLSAARADGLGATAADAQRVLEIGPEAIARSLLLRLARLPEPARELARAVAVLGRSVEIRRAAQLARLTPEEAALAADALAAAGLLRTGRPIDFAHPVLRSVVYHDMPDGQRAIGHRRAARLYLDEPDGVAHAAAHLLSADPAGEQWVVETLVRAAREEAIPEQALVHLRRALVEPPPRELLAEVLVDLGEAEAATYTPPERLVARFTAALAAADEPHLRARARLGLASALLVAGRPDEALAAVAAAVEELGPHAQGRERDVLLRLQGVWLSARGLVGKPLTDVAMRNLLELAEPGRTAGERALLANLAWDAVFAGWTPPQVIELAERALANGVLLDERLYYEHYVAVWALEFTDQLDTAVAYATEAIDRARERGSVGEYAYAHTVRALARNRAGSLPEAEGDARATLELVREHGLDRGMLPLTHAALLDVLVSRGALPEAEEVAAAAGEAGDGAPTPVTAFLLHARGRLRRMSGAHAAALADFLAAGRILGDTGADHPAFCAWRSSAALAALAGGDRERAAELARDEVELAGRWGRRPYGVALRAAALVEGDIDRLRESVRVLDESPAALERATSLIELGAALRRRKERVASREPLLVGLDIAHRCQAEPLARRAQEELAATGARPRRLVLTGVESLTASERRVARLAADGLTNREIAQTLFVSLPTVEKHLGQAYRKLEISSRRDLAAALGDVAQPA